MTPTVLITGTNHGIGMATAALFRSNGWRIAAVDRLAPSADVSADWYLQLDLSSRDIGDPLAQFIARLGRLDAVVNNAALQLAKPLRATTIQDWDLVLATNVRAPFVATQVASEMLRAVGGAIVNVGSVHALATSAGLAAYAASKGALLALTRAAALELAPEVRVNAVLPGAIDTAMLRAGLGRRTGRNPEQAAADGLAARTPLRRFGRPNEIAETILFLADRQRSSFITGQMIVADGGAMAHLSTE
jgi:NAD(P)-dependent dehydrogenase (short-subunit alcohol dehydrogenase family)